MLEVASSMEPIRLSQFDASNSNSVEFHIEGEPSRSYRIQVSENLSLWEPAGNFPLSTFEKTSVIVATSASHRLEVPKQGSRMFVRASTFVPTNAVCMHQ